MTELLTDPDAVRTALADEAYRMPPVDPAATTGIAWLRAAVARFCDGAPHARRRALATDLLDAIDPEELRVRARDRTEASLAAKGGPVEVMSAIARPVPIGVLSAAVGVESDLTPAVAAAARSYQPHATADAAADAAVATLVTAFGGAADEPTAARIALLVQACDATAGLIGTGILAGSLDAALRDDPPVRRTRRVHNGHEVQLDITGAPFGAGPHQCPGRDHALAMATGVLEALKDWRITPEPVEYEPSPALRIPARILMTSPS
jgi:cytochrome P450